MATSKHVEVGTHQVVLPNTLRFITRVFLPVVSLAALGLVHCGSDDKGPTSPGNGGSSGAGAGGKGGASGGGAGSSSGGSGGRGGAGGSDTAGSGGAAASGGAAGSAATGGGGQGGSSGAGEGGLAGEGGADPAGAGGEGGAATQGDVLHSILIGDFAPLPAYSAETFSGRAILYRTLSGDTSVSIQLVGLIASTAYPSHLHNQPCSVLAGGHYLVDPAAAAAESNEIWLGFTTDTNGTGVTETTAVGHLARGDALSIVVHDPNAANAKMACADLTLGSSGDLAAHGTFATFAAATSLDDTATGTVQALRSSSGTEVTVSLGGLDVSATYSSHVHAFPCGVTDAGGHYKIDPSNAATEQSNELWLDLGDTSDGVVSGSTSFPHRARLDAQSVVVHRDGGKVLCADLPIDTYPDVELDGTSQLFPAATPDHTGLTATAELVRGLDGMTRVHVAASGLMPGVTYPAHVHNLPCGVQSGGGHYLRDKGMSAAESNELWVPLTADGSGDADASTAAAHVATADARSIVIHDPNSDPVNARLACIDL